MIGRLACSSRRNVKNRYSSQLCRRRRVCESVRTAQTLKSFRFSFRFFHFADSIRWQVSIWRQEVPRNPIQTLNSFSHKPIPSGRYVDQRDILFVPAAICSSTDRQIQSSCETMWWWQQVDHWPRQYDQRTSWIGENLWQNAEELVEEMVRLLSQMSVKIRWKEKLFSRFACFQHLNSARWRRHGKRSWMKLMRPPKFIKLWMMNCRTTWFQQ